PLQVHSPPTISSFSFTYRPPPPPPPPPFPYPTLFRSPPPLRTQHRHDRAEHEHGRRDQRHRPGVIQLLSNASLGVADIARQEHAALVREAREKPAHRVGG